MFDLPSQPSVVNAYQAAFDRLNERTRRDPGSFLPDECADLSKEFKPEYFKARNWRVLTLAERARSRFDDAGLGESEIVGALCSKYGFQAGREAAKKYFSISFE